MMKKITRKKAARGRKVGFIGCPPSEVMAQFYDDELIVDVGYSLLARCESFIHANEAVRGRAKCPLCGAIVAHHTQKEELLQCACGWSLSWADYFATIQHKQLSGVEPVIALFQDFVDAHPRAQVAEY